MTSQFAANQWTTSPPFRPDSAHRPSTAMSALSKGSGSIAKRNSESGAAAGWMGGGNGGPDATPYTADTFGAVPPNNTYPGSSSNGVPGGNRALAKADGVNDTTPSNALVPSRPSTQLRQAAYAGLYDDVAFPVHTLFSPPQPPGELLPRTQRPARTKAVVYTNDVARAGVREHEAQREVSRVWRGVLCRRRLRLARSMDITINHKARMLQCWWRSILARRQREQLSALRSEWAKERTARYIEDRVRNTTSILYWQHGRYEAAALRIQQAVRWFLRERARQRCAAAGLPQSEWPPSLPRPLAEQHHPYFPWRRNRPLKSSQLPRRRSGELVAVGEGDDAKTNNNNITESALPHRTLLQFRESRLEVLPPSQEEVEAANAKMRAARSQRAAALQTPESVSRQQWKSNGLRHEDLDFNAGVLQRLYRSKKAPKTVHTKDLTAAYFNKAARTIARTFRMYVLLKRMRERRVAMENEVKSRIAQRSAHNIEDLKTEAVWQKDLMDAAARSIQRCYAWYRNRHGGTVPASARALGTAPSRPPYHLLDEHIERERALQWSTMNLLERRQYEERRQHRYLHYVPQKVDIYEHTAFLFVRTAS